MSLAGKSIVFEPFKESGFFTTRGSQMSSRSGKRKGISLSKELEPQKRGKSPAFLKVIQKGTKKVVVEKREIKLLLKGKQDGRMSSSLVDKQNLKNTVNVKESGKDFMGVISSNEPKLQKMVQKEFGKFPIKKSNRKERNIHQGVCNSIQLF